MQNAERIIPLVVEYMLGQIMPGIIYLTTSISNIQNSRNMLEDLSVLRELFGNKIYPIFKMYKFNAINTWSTPPIFTQTQ